MIYVDPQTYFNNLRAVLFSAECTRRAGDVVQTMNFIDALADLEHWLTVELKHTNGKIMFIGNGGSAAIASHMAIDFQKNGGLKTMAFNDAAALTCLGNDLGFENIFAHSISMHAQRNDMVVAISSSGESPDIRRGIQAALDAKCTVVTLTGFSPTNTLRALGHMNFYVPASNYGLVETAHQAILHAILDISMGWNGTVEHQPTGKIS